MTKVMLIYNNIVPISRELHKKTKFIPSNDATFAAHIHWSPLTGTEFYKAGLNYPILFMGQEQDNGKMNYIAVALLGLSNNQNDFLKSDKTWLDGVYIPAFIRRYPFVLAGKPEQEDLSVCYDSESGMFNELTGIDLFNPDGSVGSFLDEKIAFLNNFKTSMEQTREFIDLLVKMDLPEKKSVDISNAKGQKARLQDFWVVNEVKFNKLSGELLQKLHNRGFLGWIVAHLMSINNLPHLLELHNRQKKMNAKLALQEKEKDQPTVN